MNRTIFMIILFGLMLLADFYLFRSLGAFLYNSAVWKKKIFTIAWWAVPLLCFAFMAVVTKMPRNLQLVTTNFVMIVFFAKVIAVAFMGLSEGVMGVLSFFESKEQYRDAWLSRRLFIAKTGTIMGFLPFMTMSYGMFRTAANFRIHRVGIRSPKVPKAFDGMRIVQISDIHTGSWVNPAAMQDAVNMIMAKNPDLIVFTGDLVNNRTDEAYPFKEILSQLKAPYGVISVLGNHDYGNYQSWPDENAKAQNFREMLDLHKDMGWELLRNQTRLIESNGEKIAILGVENWGASPRFPKYGDMSCTHPGAEGCPFKILLSHDPSHWEAQVVNKYEDVDLTLSGHTHGFQFGVELAGIKWSPSQWIYKQWAGLYENNGQYLYVNRGTGCLGYSGRIGIRPEITLIELQSA